MQSLSVRWIGIFAGLGAGALGLARPAPASADCPYPSYVECLQAGETVDFCKQHVLNCEPGGGDDDSGGDECAYGNYAECLQAGLGVEFCKSNALYCEDPGESDPCDPLDDDVGIGCDGDATWVNLSEPYDIVLSEVTVCPYDSYTDCLLAGETVAFCKRHVLNCHPGVVTQAQATIAYDARECTDDPPCLCAQASGEITFFGVTVEGEEEICFQITSFDYAGLFPDRVEPRIEEELQAVDWKICFPLECL